MSEMRLIDANALKILPDRFKNYYRVVGARGDGKSFQTMTLGVLAKVQEAIDNAPTIDAVPVVRCRECKHYNPTICHRLNTVVTPFDFCSYGKPKMDGGVE